MALRELIGRRALDLWQPDLDTVWAAWRPGEIAQRWQPHTTSRCRPHYYKDYDIPLLATVSGTMVVRKVLIGSMELSISRWRLSMDMRCQEKERAGDSASYIST